MNTNHYPSLELCKKLKEIGFPETELFWANEDEEQYIKIRSRDIHRVYYRDYPCPSVMEMLDVIPKFILDYQLNIIPNNEWYISYHDNSDDYFNLIVRNNKTLPNALAEMVVWLVENKYLSFN